MSDINYNIIQLCLFVSSTTNCMRWCVIEKTQEGCIFDLLFACLFLIIAMLYVSKIKSSFRKLEQQKGTNE
jgi:hypothetical protein